MKDTLGHTLLSLIKRLSSLQKPLPSLRPPQTKNASHFAAWSSCLISHEMFRKTQLASGKTSRNTLGGRGGGGAGSRPDVPHPMGGINLTVNEDDRELEDWVGKTHRTIGGIKKGGWSGDPCSCLSLSLSLSLSLTYLAFIEGCPYLRGKFELRKIVLRDITMWPF